MKSRTEALTFFRRDMCVTLWCILKENLKLSGVASAQDWIMSIRGNRRKVWLISTLVSFDA